MKERNNNSATNIFRHGCKLTNFTCRMEPSWVKTFGTCSLSNHSNSSLFVEKKTSQLLGNRLKWFLTTKWERFQYYSSFYQDSYVLILFNIRHLESTLSPRYNNKTSCFQSPLSNSVKTLIHSFIWCEICLAVWGVFSRPSSRIFYLVSIYRFLSL